jgi:hypothetical protein
MVVATGDWSYTGGLINNCIFWVLTIGGMNYKCGRRKKLVWPLWYQNGIGG